MERSVQWSELPTELWAMIGRKLDTHMDVDRFRSVCSSWRSLVPPVSEFELRIGGAPIGQRMLYLLEPPPLSLEDPRCPPSREGWLIKVAEKVAEDEGWLTRFAKMVAEDEAEDDDWLINVAEEVAEDEDLSGRGKVQLFNPLSSRPIPFEDGTFPKVLCPMDYRVTWVFAERYFIGWDEESYPGAVTKVIILPDSPWAVLEETSAVRIVGKGKLKCWKLGDEDWNALDYPNCQYDDLIAYKGQFYVVDRFGIVSWIDPSFKIVQFSRPVYSDGDGGDQKHLVESGGDLYVVDRYFDEDDKLCRTQAADAADFKVYRLNQEWGKWDEIRNLGEVSLFLGNHSCFSVPVKGFSGCKGNCIFFTARGGRVKVFNMEDRSIKKASDLPDHMRILWPPPAWIAPNGFALSPLSPESPIF
ncbi:VKc domain-containing protein [Psidium guajava]|nr:VKc domain-containing protein [Psidium guajava]